MFGSFDAWREHEEFMMGFATDRYDGLRGEIPPFDDMPDEAFSHPEFGRYQEGAISRNYRVPEPAPVYDDIPF